MAARRGVDPRHKPLSAAGPRKESAAAAKPSHAKATATPWQLLDMANQFLKNDVPDQAKAYAERIIKEFPDATEVNDARAIIEKADATMKPSRD